MEEVPNSDSRLEKIYKNSKKAGSNFVSAFKEEGEETKDMFFVFNKMLRKKLNMKNRKEPPTEEEIENAVKQLKDFPKIAILAGVFGGLSWFVPGSTTTYLAAAVGLYNSTNGKVNLIPSSFEKKLKDEETGKLSIKKLSK